MPTQMNATAETSKPRVGVGVLVTKDDKVLLGKRKGAHGSDSYAPPGGNLEFKETIEACARRELIEETGLTPLSVQLGPWTEDVIDNQKHYITFFAIVNDFEGEPQLLEHEKCDGWEWYSWDDLPSPLFPSVQSLIENLGIQKLKEITRS